jgi:TusA-related sulfurtransferase
MLRIFKDIHTDMAHQTLDLTSKRCPLALLLAKRAYHALLPQQSLQIHLTDLGSLHDILRYFYTMNAVISVENSESQHTILAVKKAEPHHG